MNSGACRMALHALRLCTCCRYGLEELRHDWQALPARVCEARTAGLSSGTQRNPRTGNDDSGDWPTIRARDTKNEQPGAIPGDMVQYCHAHVRLGLSLTGFTMPYAWLLESFREEILCRISAVGVPPS